MTVKRNQLIDPTEPAPRSKCDISQMVSDFTFFLRSCDAEQATSRNCVLNFREDFMSFDLRRIFAASAPVVALIWVTGASADSPKLKGSYGFTGTAACLIAPGHVGDPNGPPLNNPTPGVALPNSGFQPNLRPNDAVPGSSSQAYAQSFSVEGIRKFNGNGTGT